MNVLCTGDVTSMQRVAKGMVDIMLKCLVPQNIMLIRTQHQILLWHTGEPLLGHTQQASTQWTITADCMKTMCHVQECTFR